MSEENCKKLAIRRLTPKESWRLMGFPDEAFDKSKSTGMSDTQLYKQAGNSIVVNCLEAIFRELLINEHPREKSLLDYINEYNDTH